MKTKLKLFIGTMSVQIFGGANRLEKKIEGIDLDMLSKGEELTIKPVLRSLDDITQDVSVKVIQAKFSRRTDIVLSRRVKGANIYYKFYDTKYKAHGVQVLDFDKLSAEQVFILAENHYDIFHWLKDDKAIDEKTFVSIMAK